MSFLESWVVFDRLWYQGGVVLDCKWAKFIYKQQSYGLYALILTSCRFGWLYKIFCSFSTELWPLMDAEISFVLNILWTNWWILIKFYKCIDIDKMLVRTITNYFLVFFFQQSYGPWLMSEFCFHLITWEQIDGFWWNFVYAVLWLTHEIFLNFST